MGVFGRGAIIMMESWATGRESAAWFRCEWEPTPRGGQSRRGIFTPQRYGPMERCGPGVITISASSATGRAVDGAIALFKSRARTGKPFRQDLISHWGSRQTVHSGPGEGIMKASWAASLATRHYPRGLELICGALSRRAGTAPQEFAVMARFGSGEATWIRVCVCSIRERIGS